MVSVDQFHLKSAEGELWSTQAVTDQTVAPTEVSERTTALASSVNHWKDSPSGQQQLL